MYHWILKNDQIKLICCVILVLLSIHNSFSFEQQTENTSLNNPQKSSFHTNIEISLDSDWEFYWNQLIEPGNFEATTPLKKVSLNNWTTFNLSDSTKLPSFGFATYRLKISVPKERSHISLYIPKAYSSSKTYINGVLISEIGRVGTSKTETIHRRSSQIIPLSTSESKFEIVIQVANFYHHKGGFTEPLIISKSNYLLKKKHKKTIADMFYIGSLGFIGTFFLFFFLFYWNKDSAVLYFGILCLSIAYMSLSDRYAPLGELFESISFIFLTKIEYFSLFIVGASANLFFHAIFSSFMYKKYKKIIIYIFSIFCLLCLFLPAPYFTKLVSPFLMLLIINLLYISYIIIKVIISKERETFLLMASMLLGLVIFFGHIIFFIYKNESILILVNFGYLVAFLLFSMLLMTRFANSFEELEESKELAIEQRKEISIKSDELKNVNLELEENLKLLKNYNTELDNFNHIVSHDLKSPLIAIHSLVAFIEEDVHTSLDKESKYHFELLKNRVSKMNALINGLLDYSKIARGNKKKELFSLNNLLSEVINLFDATDNHIFNLPEVDAEIYANKLELEHVFQNLISNSIKHNDKKITEINFSFTNLKNEYLFSVNDNGPGIDAKYHTKIFDMFSQLSNENEVESTGIGLSIVKKIISENDGTITVESEKGMGTTIKFSWRISKK
ncbi:ATP-binding protein [Lutibacter sp. Hel_I_33_5]|uniref:sensor histidine kinase n=1 Tax=Lutibacter sp. Hel_I_33_5 TaxID=1566289 RepID=UPI00164622EE|nr:ATP-binding protein [Lutibacter sp. Hel_I_33_5]